MNKAQLTARIILGLIFTVFGLNGFLNFMPIPPPTEAGGAFLGALAAAGYMFPIIKGIEVVAGIMLLAGVLAPLALILLAPIVANIVLFHTILDPKPALPLVILALGLFLAYTYKATFAPLFKRSEK